MAEYKIRFDYSNLLYGLEQVNAEVAERVQQAIGATAQKVYETWADRVMKAPGIWHPIRAAYVESLKWEYTGPYSATVKTDYRQAEDIETGQKARDLKRMLQTSQKTRSSAKGKYLIIPMRHNIPAGDGHSSYAKQMPEHIYDVARVMKKSLVVGKGTRVSATGATVPQAHYQWGGRMPSGLAPKLAPHHTTDPYAGMVRMNTSAGKGKSSQYLTFRIMGEWQADKWIVPAKPGLYIARQLSIDIQSAIDTEKG